MCSWLDIPVIGADITCHTNAVVRAPDLGEPGQRHLGVHFPGLKTALGWIGTNSVVKKALSLSAAPNPRRKKQ